jgi:hypothetical protein
MLPFPPLSLSANHGIGRGRLLLTTSPFYSSVKETSALHASQALSPGGGTLGYPYLVTLSAAIKEELYWLPRREKPAV